MPFPPGGGSDTQARLLAKKFTESMGQSFVVDNRSGAGGMIGAEIVAKAPPDGYTILFSTASLAVNATLYKKASFDPVKDLAPVSWFSSAPLILVVHPSVPAKTVKELVALAKQQKGKLNAGSNGTGTTSHLAIEMLKQQAGIEVAHIPYKGGGPAAIAIMSGEVDLRFSGALAVLPHIKAGRVRPLAVASARKSAVLPELPTLASTYPGLRRGQLVRDVRDRGHAEGNRGEVVFRSVESAQLAGDARCHQQGRRGARGQHARGARRVFQARSRQVRER